MDPIERRHPGRREVVQRGIHVPAVEARDTSVLVGGRDGRLVEGSMVGVLERRGLEALVIVDGAVANELHLRHAWDCSENRMQYELLVDSVLLLPCPYDSDVGSNACGQGRRDDGR